MRSTFTKRDGEHEADGQGPVRAPDQRSNAAVKESPGGLAPPQSAVMSMQRSLGNRFVVRALQRKCSCGGTCPKCSGTREGEAPVVTPAVADYLEHPDSGHPLEPATRDAMESRLGKNFGEVRVHRDSSAAAAAQTLDAKAFTVGKDVYFGDGKYHGDATDPLLAHELTHVAQQSEGAMSGPGSGAALEGQAEKAEHAVARGNGSVAVSPAPQGLQRKADDTDGPTATAPAQTQPPKHEGFFQRVGHAIGGAAESVWKGAKAAGKAVAKGAEALGHAITSAAEMVWNGLKWVGRQLWDKATAVFDRITHWVAKLPARLARVVMDLWEGVKTLKPWALTWWESLGEAGTWGEFLHWLEALVFHALDLGLPEAYETVMDLLKFNTRSLTGGEIGQAQSVFGGSINLDRVRVDQHAFIGPPVSHRAYTSFHTINTWGSLPDATLIHELTHVWQFQQAGSVYIAQALSAQFHFGQAAYQYDMHELRSAKQEGRGILSFNREKQAQIVEDYYRIKNNQSVFTSDGTQADLHLYAHFVREVSTHSIEELT